MKIGERLKNIRKEKSYSVYKLSVETGISQNHIHSIEKGISQPKIDTLERILKSLGLTMAEFFNAEADAYYPSDYEKELLHAARNLDSERAEILLKAAKYMKG